MPGMKRPGGQKRQWLDDIMQWSGKRLVDIVHLAENRDVYRRLSHIVKSATALTTSK